MKSLSLPMTNSEPPKLNLAVQFVTVSFYHLPNKIEYTCKTLS